MVFRRGRQTDDDPRERPPIQPMVVDVVARADLTPVSQWVEGGPIPARPMPPGPTSSLFAGVCRYFHDCFSADSRGGTLTNILDKNQAEYLVFADGIEPLATGQLDRLEVPLSTGVTAQNAADVNRREKYLIWGSIFLVGRGRPENARRKGEVFCAPLLYWPARIEQEGSRAYLSVDLDEQHINFPLLASLIDAENDEQAQAYAEAILAQAPTAPFETAAIREFAAVIAELIPDLRTEDLQAWPELQTEAALRDLQESPVQLLCASAMALVRRPQEARGVLTELQMMAGRGDMSAPLAAIFTDAARAERAPVTGMLPEVEIERPILSGAELSNAQTRVLRQSERRPLTLVIGPPGTGKSFTIAQIILDAVARGQTVLLSSKMNKAVDVVVEKLKPHLGSLTVILRGGDRRYRDELKKFLDNLFDGTGAPPRPRPGEIEMLEDRLRAADEEIAQLDAEIRFLLDAETRWTQHIAALRRIHPPAYNEAAAAALGPEALEAAYEEIHRDTGKLPVVSWMAGRKRDQAASDIASRIGLAEGDLPHLEAVLRREQLRAGLIQTERTLLARDDVNALLTRHARLRADRGALVGELLAARRREALAEALRLNRRTLSLFKTALEARSTAEQDKIFAELDFSALLNTFPIWATTNPHVAEMLPLDREMFDLVIVDEASQCDVSSALPLLYRGQRAIVCGDPKQLRHLSFLREDRQAALASQHGLSASQRSQWNYRTHSLLDVVNGALPSQDDVVLLDEHYRSLPQIIEFSNRTFYGQALRVMTRRPDTLGARSVEMRKVNGKRGKEGYNPQEAEAILKEINTIAKAEAKLPPNERSTIGVLSPYRDQVNYLTRMLAQKLKSKILQDHDIAIGTAHTYQGDERDVMLLSFCADPGSHRSTVTFMNNDNLFNVAVTRARHRQVIFTGLDARHLPPDHLLGRYLDYAGECLEPDRPEDHTSGGTAFEREIGQALRQRGGYEVYIGYPVAGFAVDVVAQYGGRALAIACDGDPERHAPIPGEVSLDTVNGQTILERAGWQVHRLSLRRWQRERERALAEIDAMLGVERDDEADYDNGDEEQDIAE
ncbi:MAG TPA: AAA domain-containing protein [Ktedonobacterales bacterium]|nr:AAA domain-containing protein [Ktedonobacterales bacterium]